MFLFYTAVGNSYSLPSIELDIITMQRWGRDSYSDRRILLVQQHERVERFEPYQSRQRMSAQFDFGKGFDRVHWFNFHQLLPNVIYDRPKSA